MKEKQFTLVFTDSELDVIYDALQDMEYTVDTENEANVINSLLFRIAEAVKVA